MASDAPSGLPPRAVAPSPLWDEACNDIRRGVWQGKRSKSCADSGGGGGGGVTGGGGAEPVDRA